MTEILTMKHNYTEIGYCQSHYTCKGISGATHYFCLMEEGGIEDIHLFRTTSDGEASHETGFKDGAVVQFEHSGDEYGDTLLKNYLKRLGCEISTIGIVTKVVYGAKEHKLNADSET